MFTEVARLVPPDPWLHSEAVGAFQTSMDQGKRLHTRNHQNEDPLEHAIESPWDNSSEDPLDK